MSGIGGITNTSNLFFVEASLNLQNNVLAPRETPSAFAQKSYDNTGKSADFLAKLRNRLQKFQYSHNSNSFLADNFSWQVKTAGVGDRDKLLVKASTSAAKNDYSVEIKRLAETEKAVSSKLDSNKTTEFTAGTYSFDLTVGVNTYSLNVEIDKTVTDPDTNKDVWRKIQSAINGVDVNVSAFISESQTKDFNQYSENYFKRVSSLTVQNKVTATEVNFSIKDTSGDLIGRLNLNKIRNSGRSNQYTVNSTSGSTNSNSVALDNYLQAQFLNPTNKKTVSVMVRDATSDLEKELINTINDYNNLVQWLDDNRRFVSSRVKNDIFQKIGSSVLNRRSIPSKDGIAVSQGNLSSALKITNQGTTDRKLSEIGLKLNNDGRLDTNDNFSAALRNDLKTVHEVLAGDDGFFAKVSSAVNNILNQSGEGYILKKSNFLSYDASGSKTNDIYHQGSSRLLSLFA